MVKQWEDYYKKRLVPIEEAAKTIQSRDMVAMALGIPGCSTELYNAILDRWEELEGVGILDGVVVRPNKFMDPTFTAKIDGHINYMPGYGLNPVRRLYQEKLADHFPMTTSDTAEKAAECANVIIAMVCPPNKQGYINLGLGNFFTSSGIRDGRKRGSLRVAIAEVNDQMPVVFGDNWMHVSEFDCFVENSKPMPVFVRSTQATEVEKTIGQYVIELIKDGDTFQMGLGGISEAIIGGLENKHDLGVLTEMLPPSLVELVEKGIVTNNKKVMHTGVSMGCFCIGDQKLYDYVTENPAAQIFPGSYTNNPAFIAQNPNVVSINTAIMTDLTGNICSEAVGHRMVSGVGGQLDFQIGAYWSSGGRAITVMRSAKKLPDGTLISSILPALPPGSPVSVPRSFADYVVTEYGVARLKYKSLRERAKALISIAHPDLRGELSQAAKKIFYPN